jgi:hypothetical protein
MNELEDEGKYHVELWNMLAALNNMDAEVDINSACNTIRGNINISAKESLDYCELKKHES